ncbi:MAG: ABC transporter permease [Thermotogae bacterium]|uniref:ABC transporter permease n=1 Tax=Kosmotoga sp. TaxID=1955248 RepID=UPI000F15B60D|nr:ABC transporter permease [Kosmotoga sp.]MBO8165800.1 ABC transporter permease [Kosmotoga sp.]MCD6160453.1 ABC transporter permease [Kosmotoga sp.]RKX51244.1 MAG: ABC transporter permease [Thermotogota bacterium]
MATNNNGPLILKYLRFKEVGGVVSLVAIFGIFGIMNPQFLSLGNLVTISTVAAELGLVTMGINLVMISGEFDLSVGSIFALTPIIFALLAKNGVPAILAVIIALAFAAGQGIVNGVVTTKGRIPSFITTLGTQWFWRGVVLAVTGGFPILLPSSGKFIAEIFGGRFGPNMRWSSLWFVGFTFLFYFILDWTRYGNWISASGGNPSVADAMGVESWKIKTSTFMISGLMAGLAGIATFARFRIVDPSLGVEMELQAITAAVIGGTLMTGGYGSAFGAFLGSIILASLNNGLILIGAPAYWYQAFVGIILVAAALSNIRIKKKLVGE